MDEEERHASIVNMLENGADAESEEEPEELESQSVEEESDASGEEDELEEEDTSVEALSEDDDDEDEVEEGHRVPYGRFKQINDQRHHLRSQLEEKERFIAELESKMQARKEPEQSYYEEESDEDEAFGSYDEIEALKQQNHAIQVKFATMEIESEIAAALEQYPNVPSEHLWESIAQDGSQRAMDVAKQYSTWVAEVEEAAINRYLNENENGEVDAPPRPSRKQTAKSNPDEESEWKPRNTDEAREAMVAYLRS